MKESVTNGVDWNKQNEHFTKWKQSESQVKLLKVRCPICNGSGMECDYFHPTGKQCRGCEGLGIQEVTYCGCRL
jgi:hypothetical protein